MSEGGAIGSGSPDRATFENAYAGTAPWDIGRPQRPFVAVAARGHRVTGIDFVDEAIRRARVKAAERGLSAELRVRDALTLGDGGERFASVIDSGLFHVFSDDERRRYVRGLARVLEPGGRLVLACFSDEEPGTEGPRRVSRQELYDAFADGWEVESVPGGPGRGEPGVHGGPVLGGWAEAAVRGRPAERVRPAVDSRLRRATT